MGLGMNESTRCDAEHFAPSLVSSHVFLRSTSASPLRSSRQTPGHQAIKTYWNKVTLKVLEVVLKELALLNGNCHTVVCKVSNAWREEKASPRVLQAVAGRWSEKCIISNRCRCQKQKFPVLWLLDRRVGVEEVVAEPGGRRVRVERVARRVVGRVTRVSSTSELWKRRVRVHWTRARGRRARP